ncbi:YcxB family protein [Nocardia sp. NPDC051030]|uniref:YcxB family protein n=1 Tax=Nocardia sp. NPDC051030 TaxID=3155162 RepID=UPI0034405595
MGPNSVSMYRDDFGAQVIRLVAGPDTARQITRAELPLMWRRPTVWLIAAAVAGAVMIYRFARYAANRTVGAGRSPLWQSLPEVLVITALTYIAVLVFFAIFSWQDSRTGSTRVRRYAYPGAVLQVRYLSDGMEVTTATGRTEYPYSRIKKIRRREHIVAFLNSTGFLVLPQEMVPAEAIAFIESR